MEKDKFTNYERTRILGARALQIAMDAPLLKKIPTEKLEELNYDPMEIAKIELEAGVLPITVKQPMPQKKSVKVKKSKPKEEKKDSEIVKAEAREEKEIGEGGEIMELANPEDEESQEVTTVGREASEELR